MNICFDNIQSKIRKSSHLHLYPFSCNQIKKCKYKFLLQILKGSYSVKKSAEAITKCDFHHRCVSIRVLIYDHLRHWDFISFHINLILLTTQINLDKFEKKNNNNFCKLIFSWILIPLKLWMKLLESQYSVNMSMTIWVEPKYNN